MSKAAFFLVGPTASGKSLVAQLLAERMGCSVVSADSMKVYCGMDIGTAKPTRDERAHIDYAGIDIAAPSEKCNVAKYLEAVRPAFAREAVPIVVGGTGLYIKCLTEGLDAKHPRDPMLRKNLAALNIDFLQRRAAGEVPHLFKKLTVDDHQNPRRLVRLLERRTAGRCSWKRAEQPLIAGLHIEREILHHRIAARVERMYAEGLLKEAGRLMDAGLSETARQAIGYAEAFAVLHNKLLLAAAKEQTIIRTRQLAKRQMTWFRNQLNVRWVDATNEASATLVAARVAEVWENIGKTPIAA